jgi:hypothetical protein
LRQFWNIGNLSVRMTSHSRKQLPAATCSSVSFQEITFFLISFITVSCNVFRVQADWTLTLRSTVSCESPYPLAEKNSAAQPELLAHLVYFFRYLLIKYSNYISKAFSEASLHIQSACALNTL